MFRLPPEAPEDAASSTLKALQWSGPAVAAAYVLLSAIVGNVRDVQQPTGEPLTSPRRAIIWGTWSLLATYVSSHMRHNNSDRVPADCPGGRGGSVGTCHCEGG